MFEGILDIFLGAFNLFTPIFMSFALVLGVFLGLILSQPKKHLVLKYLPGENRGYELEVERESNIMLHCKPFPNIPLQRFVKWRRASVFARVGRRRVTNVVRYLAREGTAYTRAPENPGKIDDLVSMKEGVRYYLGELYDKLPQKIREQIEAAKMGVTVTFQDEPLTPTGSDGTKMPTISEENLQTEDDQTASAAFWKGSEVANKTPTLQIIFAVIAGVGVGIVAAIVLGWIPLAKIPS